jgi:anti-sigma regulatory factor (Ser/Thr protein kinase)
MDAGSAEAESARVTRCRARQQRERSAWLRRRATALRTESELLAVELATNLQGRERPFGEREGAFFVRLGRLPLAVGLVRRELARWLTRDGVPPEQAAEVALACSEACANAVEHSGRVARPAFEVEARRVEGELVVAVRDFGRWNARAESSSTRGRGLPMMRRLMDSVEILEHEPGTEIVMRRSLERD